MSTVIADPAIHLTGLVKTFQAAGHPVRAVDGVDLRIDRGEIVALLGPNGAGKTTTLDMVLGLTSPTAGEIAVLGQTPREAVRSGRISAVLQTGGLIDDFTVRETVTYIASTFDTHAGVDTVLERAGIGRLARRKVSKCSGGEQQRLRFALALLPEPDLLILDEPTAGMDVNARREFWATMHAEAARGRTVLFATHYLEEADDFAQRIVLIAGGRVIADGSTAEIRSTATGRVVSARVPDLDAARAAFAQRGLSCETDRDRVVIRSADSDAVARTLLNDLNAYDVEITTGSLEDAFVALTGNERAAEQEQPS